MKDFSMFQVTLLAVFGALAVSGVLVFALLVSGNNNNSIGPVTIWGTLDPNAFSVVIRQLAEAEPRLAQVTYVQKDPSVFESDLTNALASGTGPDLFLLRQDYAVPDSGKVVPVPATALSPAQFQSTFLQAADPFLLNGTALGVPILADPLVMYWNRDMFASAGLSQPPQYWGELSDMVQKIVKKDDAGTIQKAAVSFGEYANVDNAKDIVSALILQAGGVITMRDSTGRLVPALSARTGASTSQAAESALRFYTEFANPSKIDYSWNRSLADSRAAFSAGNLALYFGYASEEALLKRANPNLNFAAAPVPQIKGAARTADVAHVYALAATRTSKNSGSAFTVAFLLAATDASRALSTALGIPSARRDVLAETVQGEQSLFNRQAIAALSWVDPDPDKTNAAFQAMIEGITSGATGVTDAISRADQEMAQIIGTP